MSKELPTTQFFTGWIPFLLPNQQRQSNDGIQSTKGINTEGHCLNAYQVITKPGTRKWSCLTFC